MKYVLNAEPLFYSKNAIKNWEKLGFIYIDSSWEIIENTSEFLGVEVLIVRLSRKINDIVLDKFPNLKFVVSATTGIDHIDLETLESRNIQLRSLREHNDFLKTIPSTAEHTWAVLLSLVRNIPQAVEDVRKGFWERDKFRGIQLKDKILGIVGMGRTGIKVAHYGKAFNMDIKYFDPFILSWEGIRSETDLKYLFEKSDIISLHVHLSKDTKYLVNKSVLQHAKKGIYIINTSRGQIINEEELRPFFENDTIKGLATDVLSNEHNNIKNNPLWKLQQEGFNILITPHIGGATIDAMNSCEDYISRLFMEY
jgi:D-3-phosphoglycerate dehydrogenase / 2-oxoglutarate reductase